MPRLRVWSTSRVTRSCSKCCSGFPRPMMIACAPARRDTCANSNEMYPAPRNAIRGGSWSSSRKAAREQVLLAGNAEESRLGSGGDHEVPRLEHLAIYRQPLRTHEPRGPMIGRDPRLLERLLPIGWHGLSEGPFELHQFGPGDMRVATHSPAPHATVPVR